MTTLQRCILIGGLLIGAWMLHTLFCEWIWREPTTVTYLVLGDFHQDAAVTQRGMRDAWGIRSEYTVDAMAAILLGMTMPVALICAAAFLAAGLRRARRRERGRCLHCGFDLRYDYARGCPECGWNRA